MGKDTALTKAQYGNLAVRPRIIINLKAGSLLIPNASHSTFSLFYVFKLQCVVDGEFRITESTGHVALRNVTQECLSAIRGVVK